MYFKKLLFAIFVLTAIYTRIVGLDWGLSYPMHPDERNMVNAIQQLSCDSLFSAKCLHPGFFAYGQITLYVGYFLVRLPQSLLGFSDQQMSFVAAALALRWISAVASLLTIFILTATFHLITHFRTSFSTSNLSTLNPFKLVYSFFNLPTMAAFLVFTFSPVLIQFAHFGTTESLLILCFSTLVFLGIALLQNKIFFWRFVQLTGLVTGGAIAVKVSSLWFITMPLLAMLIKYTAQKPLWWFLRLTYRTTQFLIITFMTAFLLSPYNLLDYPAFIASLRYESSVGLGTYIAFYTRQFEYAIPVLFQTIFIFPFALGKGIFIFFVLSFFFLPWKKSFLFLRILFLLTCVPHAFYFAKWARFIAPAYPIMILCAISFAYFAYLWVIKLMGKTILTKVFTPMSLITLFVLLIPGLAYLNIYTQPDVRFQASVWMLKNLPEGAYILSETANVVDLPVLSDKKKDESEQYKYKTFRTISFDFYNLDENPQLQTDLKNYLNEVEYIIVPSRRIFANHTCLWPLESDFGTVKSFAYTQDRCKNLAQKYPQLNEYYENLFSGKLGFSQIAQLSVQPQIHLLGKTFSFPDEHAEETWSVFDHPVIRVYKRN